MTARLATTSLGRCIYCGRPTKKRARVCRSHRDLIFLDPYLLDAMAAPPTDDGTRPRQPRHVRSRAMPASIAEARQAARERVA